MFGNGRLGLSVKRVGADGMDCQVIASVGHGMLQGQAERGDL